MRAFKAGFKHCLKSAAKEHSLSFPYLILLKHEKYCTSNTEINNNISTHKHKSYHKITNQNKRALFLANTYQLVGHETSAYAVSV